MIVERRIMTCGLTEEQNKQVCACFPVGEWIEYDTAKRGWYLLNGVSILLGDHCGGVLFDDDEGVSHNE